MFRIDSSVSTTSLISKTLEKVDVIQLVFPHIRIHNLGHIEERKQTLPVTCFCWIHSVSISWKWNVGKSTIFVDIIIAIRSLSPYGVCVKYSSCLVNYRSQRALLQFPYALCSSFFYFWVFRIEASIFLPAAIGSQLFSLRIKTIVHILFLQRVKKRCRCFVTDPLHFVIVPFF